MHFLGILFDNYDKGVIIVKLTLTIDLGWTVSDIDPQGNTALVLSFKSNNVVAFAALLEKESFENNKYEHTPLYFYQHINLHSFY